ncbi:hypothetical protein, partial [Streptococcus pneumoniae]|uniref:hypothetical protein n=1 Tax=Streptococcus pneumoniae TaxID=1313 RepID=UPI001E622B52
LQLDITETEEAIAGYIRYLTRPLKVVGRGAIATTPVTDDGRGGKFVLILVTVPHAGRVQ